MAVSIGGGGDFSLGPVPGVLGVSPAGSQGRQREPAPDRRRLRRTVGQPSSPAEEPPLPAAAVGPEPPEAPPSPDAVPGTRLDIRL